MNTQQQKKLQQAVKKLHPKETVLTGSSALPKKKAPVKKKSIWSKLFGG
jgi:hypothetical protein